VSITTPQQLRAIIEAHQPGDRLDLTVRRDGATKTLSVRLGAKTS
jgi:S1-C subfamily serine protease